MEHKTQSLPTLQTDLLLLHPSAIFDFRQRRDIYFPFLGTTGDVPITPLYEYFPVGFKTLKRYLEERGHGVVILNLSSLLLQYPALDVDDLLAALDVRMIGIDLHWMVHVQGGLAVAERIKQIQPDTPVLFGGLSASYYAAELIRYPYVDLVMKGYDTHAPMDALLQSVKGGQSLTRVPNLFWKDASGEVQENGFTHKPRQSGLGIDWTDQPGRNADRRQAPMMEILNSHNAGCVYNCAWCGGSRDAFRRIFGPEHRIARKPLSELQYEFETIRELPNACQYHYYAAGFYDETADRAAYYLEQVAGTPLRSISYEQFSLTPVDVLRRMVAANPRTSISISPGSHDVRISKMTGRGVFTNEELESWLEQALEIGILQIDLWYVVGMPEQDEKSVLETVAYCEHLLEKFPSGRVNPMICPMMPFLDPASTYFERPEKHGYRLFYRSLEAHRQAMGRASIINRMNYETRWLSRSEIFSAGYRAVQRLMEAKAERRILPASMVRSFNARLEDALEFNQAVYEADCLEDPHARGQALESLGDEIQQRNETLLYAGVANQAVPIFRDIGSRWIDELGWSAAELEAAATSGYQE